MSDKLFFDNKEYILGATIGPKIGTGGMTYSLIGLDPNKNQKLIIVSGKNTGVFSNIVGPIIINQLNISNSELREDFGAIVWEYPPFPQHYLQYWTGSEINLLGGSEELSPPYWNTSGLKRVKAGITLPNGYNHGVIVNLGDTQIATGIYPILGITYYFSWYEYRSYNTNQIGFLAYQGAGDVSNIIGRQLLPQQGVTVGPVRGVPLGPTGGQTGWVRYAYEFVVKPNTANATSPMTLGWYTYGGGPGGTYYLGAPQLELAN